MPGYCAHPCIIICESRLRNARLDIRRQRRTIARDRRRNRGSGADQVRAGDQSQDREGARSRCAAVVVRRCRRGDRITMPFAAVHESAFSTKRTFLFALRMSAFGGKADMAIALRNVR